jgi:hypothetical protein
MPMVWQNEEGGVMMKRKRKKIDQAMITVSGLTKVQLLAARSLVANMRSRC